MTKKLVYMSQFKDSSGYAVAARGYLKALDAYLQENPGAFELKIHSFVVEHAQKLSDHMLDIIDKYEFKSMDEVNQWVNNGDYIFLWHMPPPMIVVYSRAFSHKEVQWEAAKRLLKGSAANVNLTVWEADAIPESWAQIYRNFDTDSVIVPSDWNKQVFSSCLEDGVICNKVTHLLDKKRVLPEARPMKLPVDLSDKFVVFSMSQWNNRKGFDKLVKSFCMEFGHQEDVVLVIKTYIDNVKFSEKDPKGHFQAIANELAVYKQSIFLDKEEHPTCKVMVIPDIVPFENITWLYQQSDVFALLTRGEGFGFTVAEAMMHKKPVIAPNVFGFFDYLDPDIVEKIYDVSGHWAPYENRPGYSCNMNWFEPHINSARQCLRSTYNLWKNNKEKLDSIGESYYNSIMKSESFDEQLIGEQLFGIFNSKWESLEVEEPQEVLLPSSPVKKKLSELKWAMQGISDVEMSQARLDLLKNAFEGETCYILNCGPSLNEYTPEFLEEFLADKLTFAVKQAIAKAPGVVDFHFFNCSNLPEAMEGGVHYNYSPLSNRPIAIGSSNYRLGQRWNKNVQECDLFFKVPIRTQINNEFLVRTLEFDRYTMGRNINRPCGPGIMYETVIFMAQHLGVKEIVVLGWDLSQDKNINPDTYKHFYGSTQHLVNRGDILPWEIEETRAASEQLARWLETRGVKLKLASTQSSLWDGIERVKLTMDKK